ncbi:hypothetical protein IRB23SM22_01420 [Alkalibacterium sp. s-m-22]
MSAELSNWDPLTVKEVSAIFSETHINWGIAGGWALDLYLGRKTRKHDDTDVVIFREDHQIVYQLLKNEWTLYKAEEGKLSLWLEGEELDVVNDVWVKKNSQSPWAFQIMLMDSELDNWMYQREKMITFPKAELFYKNKNNIPYLKPTIQLLYKGGSSQLREKDSRDFQVVFPSLSLKEKSWLQEALKKQFPLGHPWLK